MIEHITDIKKHFESILDQRWSRTEVPGGEWEWLNIRWTGDGIRWAHLEEYTMTPKVHILHLVIMPELDNPTPIYGFDLIGLSGQMTGLFIDFTETGVPAPPATEYQFRDPRPRPDWAYFFSDHFVCVKPNEDELDHATQTLSTWLDIFDRSPRDQMFIDMVREKQYNYCINQQKNDKTRKMLTAHIGQERADQFVDEVLFPAGELK